MWGPSGHWPRRSGRTATAPESPHACPEPSPPHSPCSSCSPAPCRSRLRTKPRWTMRPSSERSCRARWSSAGATRTMGRSCSAREGWRSSELGAPRARRPRHGPLDPRALGGRRHRRAEGRPGGRVRRAELPRIPARIRGRGWSRGPRSRRRRRDRRGGGQRSADRWPVLARSDARPRRVDSVDRRLEPRRRARHRRPGRAYRPARARRDGLRLRQQRLRRSRRQRPRHLGGGHHRRQRERRLRDRRHQLDRQDPAGEDHERERHRKHRRPRRRASSGRPNQGATSST